VAHFSVHNNRGTPFLAFFARSGFVSLLTRRFDFAQLHRALRHRATFSTTTKLVIMPWNLTRYYGNGNLHFITLGASSCELGATTSVCPPVLLAQRRGEVS